MPPHEADLGTAELEVLKALWTEGPSTVREVMNHLHARDRKVAYTTVLTFLTRLESKGFVKSDRSEVAYRYAPTVSRERVSRSRLRSLLEELYDGAAAPLVLQLVRDERFSPEEIAQLQVHIDALENRAKTKRRPAAKRRGRA